MPSKTNGMDAVSAFQSSLSRFNAAYGEECSSAHLKPAMPRNAAASPAKKLEKAICLSEAEFKKQVAERYEVFFAPKDSATEREQNLLLAAYRLYCGIQELNAQYESAPDTRGTCIAPCTIKSPLLQNVRYATGSQWTYLMAWFMFTQADSAVVPLLTEQGIKFIPREEFSPPPEVRRILSVIRESFYS